MLKFNPFPLLYSGPFVKRENIKILIGIDFSDPLQFSVVVRGPAFDAGILQGSGVQTPLGKSSQSSLN